jgi:hypothetical protein
MSGIHKVVVSEGHGVVVTFPQNMPPVKVLKSMRLYEKEGKVVRRAIRVEDELVKWVGKSVNEQ